MRTADDSRRYLENWQEEIDSAAEYRAMAHSEPDASLARVYGNLARMEEAHITFWEDRLRLAGVEVGARRPSWLHRCPAHDGTLVAETSAETIGSVCANTDDSGTGGLARRARPRAHSTSRELTHQGPRRSATQLVESDTHLP